MRKLPVEIYYQNESFFRFVVKDNETNHFIRRHFTHEVPSFVQKKYNITHTCIIHQDEFLYVGLYNEFIELLKMNNIDYIVKDIIVRFNNISSQSVDKFIEKTKINPTPRWYQKDAFQNIIENRRHLVLSPTSSGKSLIIAMMVRFFLNTMKTKHDKFLLIVPNKMLVEQMWGDIIGYFSDSDVQMSSFIQRIHGEIPQRDRDLSKPIIITTWQSQKNTDWTFESQFTLDFMQNVKILIYDEAHVASAPKSRKIIEQAHNTEYRIGTTGTLPDDAYKEMLVKGLFGDTIQTLTTRQMIDYGYASPLKIYQILMNFGEQIEMDYNQECSWLREQTAYSDWIVNFLGKNFTGENVIALYRSIEYGNMIKEQLKRKFPKKTVLMINGGVVAKERMNIRSRIEKENDIILLATYDTMSTGVSIKNLHSGVFIESMKSSVKVIQSIGRLLRKHPTKEMAYIYDLVPSIWTKKMSETGREYAKDGYLKRHGECRKELYEREEHLYEVMKVNMNNK